MENEVKIPSEMLEPIVSKTIGEIFEHFSLGYWDYKECIIRINSLSHLADNAGAIHCQLAINNVIGLMMKNENNQSKLKSIFKKVTEKHYNL